MVEEKKSLKTMFIESTVVQGLVTLVLLCVISYQVLVGEEVPEFFAGLLGLTMGFWFRSKAI